MKRQYISPEVQTAPIALASIILAGSNTMSVNTGKEANEVW